jgi:regulator of cell morphogenesis and NO signaling
METKKTLGEIVANNYKAASVFEKFGLDFCCMGNQSLEDACNAGNVNLAEVNAALRNLAQESSDQTNFNQWPLDLLADYIYNRHHKYIEEKTPVIKGYLDKICTVHGQRHPELFEIRKIFDETSGELAVHLKKEELTLFPYIKRMVKAKEEGTRVKSPLFDTVLSPIQVMKTDHLDEGEQLRKMSALSNNYTPPADACSTYTVAYRLLDEYEKDIHVHIHLENNILFAKSLLLEEELSRL